MLHVISQARFALAEVRGWTAGSLNAHLRRAAQPDQAQQEITLLSMEVSGRS